MRTTRRGLLGLIGMGAAAVAVGGAVEPVKAAEAASAPVYDIPVDPAAQEALARVKRGLATWDEFFSAPVDASTETSTIGFYGVQPVPAREYLDAIAQARADGYNRGREVEAAAWEARVPNIMEMTRINAFEMGRATGMRELYVSGFPSYTATAPTDS